jgi:hypothetical protein
MILAIVCSFGFVYALINVVDQPQVLAFPDKTLHDISENITDFPLHYTIAPRYFTSVGNIRVAYSSQYADAFQIFELNMSLDQNEWTQVPLTSEIPINVKDYTDLGYISLTQVRITIYCRMFVPPQNLSKPSSVTKQEVLDSFRGQFHVNTIRTGKDLMIMILVFLTMYRTLLSTLRYYKVDEKLSRRLSRKKKVKE